MKNFRIFIGILGILMFSYLFFGVIGINNVLADSLYTVRSGDSLYLISRMYGVSVNSIKSANSIRTDTIYPGQNLTIPSRARSLKDILAANGLEGKGKLDILVDKSDHTLSILSQSKVLKVYHVEIGDNGLGDKSIAGDHKTPEGTFYITEKSVLSPADMYLGSRWMRLSYPNVEDAARGLKAGLINNKTYNAIQNAINSGTTPPQNTALGGGVGIHGGSTSKLGNDWTWGCVGLSNKDVEDFFDSVYVGTKVTIQK